MVSHYYFSVHVYMYFQLLTIRLGCHYNTTVTSLPLCLTIVLQLYHHGHAAELAEDKDLLHSLE